MKGYTRREKLITNINEIKEILDKARVLHLGLADGDMPYVVPMNYGYTMDDGKPVLWLHCATQGRKLDIIRENPKVFFSIECDIQPFEGDVACRYGMGYRSLLGSGVAQIIEDVEIKKNALTYLMKTQTGKDFEFNDKLVSVVSIIKIDVAEYTAKYRPVPERK